MAKAVYKTHCDICFCSFSTTNALQRHRVVKHRGARSISFLPFYKAEEVVQLPSNKFKGRRPTAYKLWIAGIAESINSCLHPKAKGECDFFACLNKTPNKVTSY